MNEILNGDGTVGGQTISSDDAPADGGQLGEAPPRSESQLRAAAEVKAIQARGFAGEPMTRQVWAHMDKLSRWASGIPGAIEPTELRAEKPEDHRPVDSTRDDFEAVADRPIPKQEMDRLVSAAVLAGAPHEAASAGMSIAQEIGLDLADTGSFMKRIGALSRDGHLAPEGIVQQSESDHKAGLEKAARAFGSQEKLQQISVEVREFLQARGVLERLDAAGVTQSAIALDPALLVTLHHRALVWRARGRK